jgi:(E)-4-hydroxy-3-methylbut-2-enyl-diphosphate synthase
MSKATVADRLGTRRPTREVAVGCWVLGGSNPIRVQSMTTEHTEDLERTAAQVRRLEEASCEIIRVTVRSPEAAANLPALKAQMRVPLVADIHFNYRMALAALANGADKIRLNPGNIGGPARFREVVDRCKDRGVPLRIGVNSGSLEADLLEKYGYPSPEALVASALRHVEDYEGRGFRNLVVSIKSSDVQFLVQANRLFSQQCDYPLHLGVTEAGLPGYGHIKSAAGLGALLVDGIGDTIRVSLSGDPEPEVQAGFDILKATGRRFISPEIIVCPGCGRLEVDLPTIAQQVQDEMKRRGITQAIQVSVMGCPVNGVGEASEADIGLGAGKGKGMLYRKGVQVKTVAERDMVEEVLKLVEEEVRHREMGEAPALPEATSNEPAPNRRLALPMISPASN